LQERAELAKNLDDPAWTYRDWYNDVAVLALPRAKLEADVVPMCERPWKRGEGGVMFGPVLHGAPGAKPGVDRPVAFMSAHLPGGAPYDANFQLAAWCWSRDVASCSLLNARHVGEWSEYEPERSYRGREKQVRLPPSVAAVVTVRPSSQRRSRLRVPPGRLFGWDRLGEEPWPESQPINCAAVNSRVGFMQATFPPPWLVRRN
jgi:hypothetical protein